MKRGKKFIILLTISKIYKKYLKQRLKKMKHIFCKNKNIVTQELIRAGVDPEGAYHAMRGFINNFDIEEEVEFAIISFQEALKICFIEQYDMLYADAHCSKAYLDQFGLKRGITPEALWVQDKYDNAWIAYSDYGDFEFRFFSPDSCEWWQYDKSGNLVYKYQS